MKRKKLYGLLQLGRLASTEFSAQELIVKIPFFLF